MLYMFLMCKFLLSVLVSKDEYKKRCDNIVSYEFLWIRIGHVTIFS